MNNNNASGIGTSVFDPALCELNYLWFTNEGDKIIDPFAGGSVRGIVASLLNRKYVGIDLRKEQVEANNENADEICINNFPKWYVGDSLNIKTIAPDKYDFIFTCPPYGDLEVYSDDPSDLSNMNAQDFENTYTKILKNTVDLLDNDRFATIVVGNYRNKNGYLIDLVGITVKAMEDAGAKYYNDIIFNTPIGSLPTRSGRQFSATRKVGRNHQYVLNFVKGNPKNATTRLDDIEIPDLSEYEEYENFNFEDNIF